MWAKFGTMFVVIATYAIPLLVIIVCYALILRDMWNKHNNVASFQQARLNGYHLVNVNLYTTELILYDTVNEDDV